MEEVLFKALKDKKVTRKDIIPIYANFLYFMDLVDWKKVNKAIINKWSRSGLIFIKKGAWKKLEKSKKA